jgi:tryptophanyl-tRNA synthetase
MLSTAIHRGIADGGAPNFLTQNARLKKWLTYKPALREPEALLTETPRFVGTDGRRMAKSYGNAIWLSESDESIRAKTKVMMTDPARKRRTDPGNPEVCPAFSWHKLFSPPETIAWADQGCRTAGIGCIECKEKMADGLIRWIEPIRARRTMYEAQPEKVWQILEAGSAKARKTAKKTMKRVREAIFAATQAQKQWKSGASADSSAATNKAASE